MDGMDEQTRAHQIWLESHREEPDLYFSYAGQKVFCPNCGIYVSIIKMVGVLKDSDIAKFQTSCGDNAYGSFSDGFDAEWCFWIN